MLILRVDKTKMTDYTCNNLYYKLLQTKHEKYYQYFIAYSFN
ncbi:MAG: hypothetical protein US40_C0007G0047 [Candidatus Roizmanbacteria bacterium GW2011_GWC2_37_13]|uniref:Uncharacterized protein n=1 Tax=Candidatus Roizmanbacteria bacterium GW2011_GWC2_37_13 TaxID=1618486 RepID=A0A0G0G2Y6_9BACT|nr:MAG: hypothetical protein US38_C0012G0050 [Candidatus Roizmanbacteria bacterium GW2011_GWC1_37_12]KKQ25548.1 MAG: hypothetical protein US40_C0007G0047 [Candidatus Roizmanbacteria bacterium GW2011_GWC2_37_13]